MTAPGRDLHGRPTLEELLDAVLGYLRDELMERVEGPERHRVRIAVHALEMVDREVRLGPDQAERHARRLRELGFGSDAELARAIRAGQVDDTEQLRRALEEDTADRLRVANPRWLPGGPDAL